MTVLAIRDLTLRIGGRTLLDAASLQIDVGRKIGLVGKNGAGKSTLLGVILREREPDGGEIVIATRARLGHVAQEIGDFAGSLLENVLVADTERASLLTEADAHPDAARLAEIHERLIAIGADAAPSRAATVLAGLGFNAEQQARPLAEFSGGWRMRVALARALFLEPDLLLLDEPTNHLDLEAALWLEGWLGRFSGAAIIVSHDRGLLDRCVDAIAHLDRGKIALYPGNFEQFVRIRSERMAQQVAANARIIAERAHIKSFVDRFRAKASKARQAQSRLKALERMPEVEAVIEDQPVRFDFPQPAELSPPIIAMSRLEVGYGGPPVLRDLNLRLDQEDRIALLGSNGNGKSTLAKLLAGRLAKQAGEIHRDRRLKVGYFAQHQTEELDPRGTPLTHIRDALPLANGTRHRGQLARFGLDADRADTPVGSLSGGEKARLLLALCTRDAPHLLILDEPTNHLDIDAREALVRALADFSGAVILITHDPHMVELIADRLWLVADGTVKSFDGDMDDYRVFLAERARGGGNGAAREEAVAPRPDPRRDRTEARLMAAPLRARLREVDLALDKLNKERALIERRLGDPATYAKFKSQDITWATGRRAAIAREVEALESEWLNLQERLETAA